MWRRWLALFPPIEFLCARFSPSKVEMQMMMVATTAMVTKAAAVCLSCGETATMTKSFLRACTHLYAFSRAIWDGRKLEKLPLRTSNVEAHHKISEMERDERTKRRRRKKSWHHWRLGIHSSRGGGCGAVRGWGECGSAAGSWSRWVVGKEKATIRKDKQRMCAQRMRMALMWRLQSDCRLRAAIAVCRLPFAVCFALRLRTIYTFSFEFR